MGWTMKEKSILRGTVCDYEFTSCILVCVYDFKD